MIYWNESRRFRTEGDHIVFTHVPESLPEDEAHARKMENRTSETRRRDVTAHFTWSPDRTGPQNLESRRRVKIGTLSSCKMDTRIGLRAILRPLRCDRNSTFFVEILASIPRARKSLHRQVNGVHESVLGPTPRLTIRRLLIFHKPTGSQQRDVRRGNRRSNDSDGSTWPTR